MTVEHARELMTGLSGLFVGLLSEEEIKAFEVLKEHDEASDNYDHAGGLLGLSKVKLKIKH